MFPQFQCKTWMGRKQKDVLLLAGELLPTGSRTRTQETFTGLDSRQQEAVVQHIKKIGVKIPPFLQTGFRPSPPSKAKQTSKA